MVGVICSIAASPQKLNAHLELLEQRLRHEGQPAGNDDHVVGRAARPALHAIAVDHDHVLHAVALEVGARQADQLGLDLHGAHPLGARCQQRGEPARAGADLEHGVGLGDAQRLQDLALDHRLEHDLVAADRDLDVGEGQLAMHGGNEFLALDRHQEVEHVLIQHLPGADLLLDHVEARFLEVHQGLPAKY
jgi:hypothetical protein